MRIADNARDGEVGEEVDAYAAQLQRVFVQCEAALHQFAHVQRRLARGRRTREEQQVLHYFGGAPCLLPHQFVFARRRRVRRGRFQQFERAQDRGQRIVQLVRESVDHLSHRSHALVLDQLLLHLLHVRHVADAGHHASHLALGVVHRAGRGAQHAPRAVAVLRVVFRRIVLVLSGDDLVEHPLQIERGGRAVRNQAAPDELLGLVAQQVAYARANELVFALAVEDEDEVGEAVHQAAAELLLLVQALLGLAQFGDIDQRALVTLHLSRPVEYRARAVQANDHRAVALLQLDLALPDHRGLLHVRASSLAL